jgi:transposase-like protein
VGLTIADSGGGNVHLQGPGTLKAIRRNKENNIQRYLCTDCGRRFSFNIGFDRMHLSPQIITSALQLFFTGESFRNV